uniref:Uncharacterized protein n=1 Tax=Chlamydomonas euryale TaxID=1486919 RepID=A0A7R9V641_9CHLO|mmetsp:Transcript_21120/g.63194  ORF Transcript_21120/g.63194 Transcript_21120/m.63194 type:complete len:103 (+) Transcript_21120:1029-1337(+)
MSATWPHRWCASLRWVLLGLGQPSGGAGGCPAAHAHVFNHSFACYLVVTCTHAPCATPQYDFPEPVSAYERFASAAGFAQAGLAADSKAGFSKLFIATHATA